MTTGAGENTPPGVRVTRWQDDLPVRADVEARLRAEGLSPRSWGNPPGDRYGWHSHDYRKVLYCVSGSIVFHTRDGDVALSAGDRLDLAPGTDHAATVGLDGVECLEAAGPTDA